MRKPKKLPRSVVISNVRGRIPAHKFNGAKVVPIPTVAAQLLGIGGVTVYDKKGKVTEVHVPELDDARGRSITGHESGHASMSRPTRRRVYVKDSDPLDQLAAQIVEDCRDESRRLPANVPSSYRRDALATAMADMRSAINRLRSVKMRPLPIEDQNTLCAGATRVLSMLHSYDDPEDWKSEFRREKLINAIDDPMLVQALEAVGQLARTGKWKGAFQLLRSLLEFPDPTDWEEGDDGPKGPTLQPEDEDDGRELMEVIELQPRTAFTVHQRRMKTVYSQSGPIINPSRFVNAVIGRSPNGLFSRRSRNAPGGTVIIDASGSMSVNNENLTHLCRQIPTATIAYYCGRRSTGALYVYARDGRRFDGKLPRMGGNNVVDLPAVQWLTRQPRPWTLVSDLEFCGGPLGHAEAARAIVRRLQNRHQLTVISSINDATIHFATKERR